MEDLSNIKKQVKNVLNNASNLEEIDEIWREYLGRKGIITKELRSLKDFKPEDRKKRGQDLNKLKEDLENIISEKIALVQSKEYEEQIKEEWIDVTRPASRKPRGSIHPLSKTIAEIEDIFASMGFASIEGPQIESEWYNFEALNIPEDHPARDLWDTFWLKGNKKTNKGSDRMLLRTHTSPAQIHYMEKNEPPLRIIVPGPVFRYEATDASHEIEFYQLEGLMVDKDISVANFRAVMEEFFSRYFGKNINIRLRPSFFPFVEPGFEVDITCTNCDNKGCSVCSQTGWLELMGAGMVHPKVFEAAGYNPKHYTGFAFGVGIDRLAMMKYKIDDVRLFRAGDVRFLEQFK